MRRIIFQVLVVALACVFARAEVVSRTVTPTLDTSAYADNDCLGGVIEVPNAGRTDWESGLAQNWVFIDKDAQGSAWVVYVFEENPANGTYTDNAALSVDDSDWPFLVDKFQVTALDWTTEAGASVAVVEGRTAAFDAGTSLYLLIMVDGSTPTHTASGVIITAEVIQD